MRLEFRTSERIPFAWTADLLALPGQDDLVIRDGRVFRVAKVIHCIGDLDVGSRIAVIVDPLAIEPGDVLA